MSVQRPISPHLQIYRQQITMVLSILHRITGLFLCLGLVMLVCWVVVVAAGPEAYAKFQNIAVSWPGRLLLLGLAFSLIFHLCAGVRHLFWDMGMGFDLNTTTINSWAIVVISLLGTLIAGLSIFGGAE